MTICLKPDFASLTKFFFFNCNVEIVEKTHLKRNETKNIQGNVDESTKLDDAASLVIFSVTRCWKKMPNFFQKLP